MGETTPEANPWDDYAKGWDDDSAARAYAAAVFAALCELVSSAPDFSGVRVLDFGSGTGLLTEQLVDAGATVCAVDSSHAMLDVLDAKARLHESGRLTTRLALTGDDREFDVIACSSVCAFLDDYPSAVSDLATRLTVGGLFIQWDWERGVDDDDGLTRTEIESALRGAALSEIVVDIGFEIEFEDMVMAPLVGHGRRPVAP